MESDPFWDHVWEQWAADAAGDRSRRRERSRDRVLEPSKVYFETVQSPPGVPEAFRNASNTFEGRRGV